MTATDDVAHCRGLLSQVSSDVSLDQCCSFTYSPTIIERKLVSFTLVASEWHIEAILAAVWPSNQFTVCRARLSLRWLTIRGYAILVCNWPLRQTQPPILSGIGNKYQPRDSCSAFWLEGLTSRCPCLTDCVVYPLTGPVVWMGHMHPSTLL